MPYTDVAALSAQLAVPLTGPLADLATLRAAQATAWIDAYCGRTFEPLPVAGEAHPAASGRVVLRQAPVATVTAVQYQPAAPAPPVALAPATWRLVVPRTGELLLTAVPRDGAGWWLVDYVPAGGVPAPVALAATLLAAHWLLPVLHPERQGLRDLWQQQDLRQTLAPVDAVGVPAEVLALLRPLRRRAVA